MELNITAQDSRELPHGWIRTRVGNLATFASGEGINVAALHARSQENPYPVYGGNGIAGYTTRAITNTPSVAIGRVGQKCGAVYFVDGPAWITDNALYPRRIAAEVDTQFLAFALEGAGLNDVRNRNDLPLITQGILHATEICWPTSFEEQRAIARALCDVDTLLEELMGLIAKKRNLKQAAMQQLLTGRTRLPGFHGAWEPRRLGMSGQCLRGVSYRGDRDLWDHETAQTIRLLRSNNLQDSAVTTTEVQFVGASCVSQRQRLIPKDIVICMANGSKALVGKVGLFNLSDAHAYTFGAFMGCFRADAGSANPEFIFALMQSARYREYIANLLAGSSINNLRPSTIESLEFDFPPLSEQTAIATVLSDMDAELGALEARRAKTQATKQAMMQKLLTGRIRLVNAEPAHA